ncbi:MAG TPA: flagellar hook protein FlgE [Stellaceae bacterium]|jgi:flagellar hook protein FlgE|nr:flagellar hook protein FlgE [Stellaceae bacterium]
MSLYGALLAGVSGLKAQAQSLATVSDNIANVNTIGYKRTVSQFSTLVTGAGSDSSYSPGGLRASPTSLIDQQGVLNASTRATDVSILGNGFFVVNVESDGSGETLYTRAGAFSEDNAGNLRNSAGYYLQGWELDQQGNIVDVNTIGTVAVGTLNGVAVDTTTVQIGANLDSDQTPTAYTPAAWLADPTAGANTPAEDAAANVVTPNFERQIKVFDSLGTPHNLTISFNKLTTTNTWGFAISAETPADVTLPMGTSTVAGGLLAFGTLTFNGDGSLNAVDFRSETPGVGTNDTTQTVEITWANGATSSNITFDLGTAGALGTGRTDGVTQFSSDNSIAFINQDGAEVGLRTGVSIDKDGYVIAAFSNGATQRIYKLPIATFSNPNDLEARNGNAYAQTDASGEFNLREANTGGAGRVEPSSLEGSNVDLSEEFTTMIVTQRAYSASAKTITTADEMLDELLRIKR